MLSMELPRVTEVRLRHSENAPAFIVFREFGRPMEVSSEHAWNALSPIEVTELEMSTEDK